MKTQNITRPLALTFLATVGWGQGLQNSGLQYLQTIGIPGWKATGAAGNANVDLMGYNPVTRMMYLADRTNNGIDVIDTRANVVVGLIKMPPASPPKVLYFPRVSGYRYRRGGLRSRQPDSLCCHGQSAGVPDWHQPGV